VMAFRVIEAAGLDKDKDMRRERLGVAESVNALKDGKIDAFFWVGGLPTAAVTDLGAGETMGARGWENVALFAAVAAPLVASVVVGVRGWRREGLSLALRAAVLSAGLLVLGAALVLMS